MICLFIFLQSIMAHNINKFVPIIIFIVLIDLYLFCVVLPNLESKLNMKWIGLCWIHAAVFTCTPVQ
eukprot:UN12468